MHYLLNFYRIYCVFYLSFSFKTLLGTPIQWTNPPQTDLDALPDPRRANYEISYEESILLNIPLSPTAKQAKPDADEAIPEAVGKLLKELI